MVLAVVMNFFGSQLTVMLITTSPLSFPGVAVKLISLIIKVSLLWKLKFWNSYFSINHYFFRKKFSLTVVGNCSYGMLHEQMDYHVLFVPIHIDMSRKKQWGTENFVAD